MTMSVFKRILLKLSGEALAGNNGQGIDPIRLQDFCTQIREACLLGVQTGIVIGGGNIFRGVSGQESGFDRVTGDYMGMLATVINGLAIQSGLKQAGKPSRLFTAVPMEPVGERYSKERALECLENNETAIFTFGTGNPYFTTDTAAALRAVETGADVLLKGTRVDGVYDADPEITPGATKFDTITFDKVIELHLKVMDQTAFTLCRENNLPVIVFNMNRPGNLLRLLKGEKIGTLIEN
jgi:uridylate kinase